MPALSKEIRLSPKTWYSLLLSGLLLVAIAFTQMATLQTRDSRSQAAGCTISRTFIVNNPTSIQPTWSGWDGHYYTFVFKNGLTRDQANSANQGWQGHNTLDSDGTTSITATGLADGVGYSGEVFLHQTTNFIKWATVSISPGSCPTPNVNLSADSSSIAYNGSTTLRWTVSNATSCTASNGWSGGKNASGGSESTGNLTSSRTYTLTCTGSGGSHSDSQVVNVAAAPQPPPPVNPPPVQPPPPPVNPPPVNPPPPPVGVNPPPPVGVNPPPPPAGGCLVFCSPPPPPPPLVKPPAAPTGPKLTTGSNAASSASATDIILNFPEHPYLQGGMETIVTIDGTGVSQKVVIEKKGGSYVLNPGTLSKGTTYKMRASSKNSLIASVSFTYNNNTSVTLPMIIAGDFNNDNQINQTDLDKLKESGFKSQDVLYDVNYDSVVNSIDYSLTILNLGKTGT